MGYDEGAYSYRNRRMSQLISNRENNEFSECQKLLGERDREAITSRNRGIGGAVYYVQPSVHINYPLGPTFAIFSPATTQYISLFLKKKRKFMLLRL